MLSRLAIVREQSGRSVGYRIDAPDECATKMSRYGSPLSGLIGYAVRAFRPEPNVWYAQPAHFEPSPNPLIKKDS